MLALAVKRTGSQSFFLGSRGLLVLEDKRMFKKQVIKLHSQVLLGFTWLSHLCRYRRVAPPCFGARLGSVRHSVCPGPDESGSFSWFYYVFRNAFFIISICVCL